MSSVKKNYIYTTIYNILSMIIPLVTTPYIARVLGPEGVGTYSYTYSIAYYFALLIMLGLNKYGNRSVSAVRGNDEAVNRLFCEIYTMQFSFGMAVVLLYVVCTVAFFKTHRLIQMIQLLYVLSAVFDVNWFFWGIEEFKLTVIRNTIIRILNLVLVFVCVGSVNGVIAYTAIMAGTMLLSQLSLWPVLLSKHVKLYIPKQYEVTKHIKENVVLFIPTIAVSLYKIMDKIMLGNMVDTTSVGFYENAEKIVNIPMLLVTSLGTVMLPRMSNVIAKGDKGQEKRYLDTSMIFVLWMSVAMCFGIVSIAERFVPWFLGDKFVKTISLVRILIPTLVLISWGSVVSNQILLPYHKDAAMIRAVGGGAICNLILNCILIPKIQEDGAAIATLVTEIVVCIAYTRGAHEYFDWKKYLKYALWLLIPGIIMAIVVAKIGTLIPNDLVCLGMQCVVGVAIYVLLTLVFIRRLNKDFYTAMIKCIKQKLKR